MDSKFLAGCSSRKRKQPDGDEETLRDRSLVELPIENEYEHLDDENDIEDENEDEEISRKKKNDYEQMLAAQEPATIERYDDIKITPFNLEEELEDGEFDKAGTFLFKKEQLNEDENDTWAESIDWSAVERKERELEQAKASQMMEKSEPNLEEPEPPMKDKLSCYKQMLRIMRHDENVQRTIRRLGKDVPKRRPIKLKNNPRQPIDTSDNDAIANARKKLDLMIELAHQRLEDGEIDIYQKSFEDLEEAIN